MSNTVTLKDGTVELKVAVDSTIFILKNLMINNPLLFYNLVMLARDETYVPFGDSLNDLKEQGLILSNLKLHNTTRNIIKNAVKGESLQMHIVSPVKE